MCHFPMCHFPMCHFPMCHFPMCYFAVVRLRPVSAAMSSMIMARASRTAMQISAGVKPSASSTRRRAEMADFWGCCAGAGKKCCL